LTAGASAPEVLVQEVVEKLGEWGVEHPRELDGQREHVVFALPRELRLKPPSP
jgi:4-hydroxy-3-methylbut-2-enyl diphosphate reductase